MLQGFVRQIMFGPSLADIVIKRNAAISSSSVRQSYAYQSPCLQIRQLSRLIDLPDDGSCSVPCLDLEEMCTTYYARWVDYAGKRPEACTSSRGVSEVK